MQHKDRNSDTGVVKPGMMGAELWNGIPDLHLAWVNAIRMGDQDRAISAEQALRVVALAYASLVPDAVGVTTGRKAIVRSIYAELGDAGTDHVLAMLDCVIEREQATAQSCWDDTTLH